MDRVIAAGLALAVLVGVCAVYLGNYYHADFTEGIIEGGCHAGFGMYGPQDGDGAPAISASGQINAIAELTEKEGQ